MSIPDYFYEDLADWQETHPGHNLSHQPPPQPQPAPRPSPKLSGPTQHPVRQGAGLIGAFLGIQVLGGGFFAVLLLAGHWFGWAGLISVIVAGTIVASLFKWDTSPSRRGPTWPY